MFCEECGTRLPEGAKFCENCGALVSAAAPAAAAPFPRQSGGRGPKLYYPDPGRYRKYQSYKDLAAQHAADIEDDFED